MRLRIAFVVLALSALACGQYVGTPTPVSTPTPPAATPSPAPTASPLPATATEAGRESETATVRAALVNVRQEPGGEVVGQLTAGTDVRVMEYDESGDWAHISDPDGWVFVGCLSISDGRGCEAR